MIDYKLRQEKQGGYLMRRSQGVAFPLSQSKFDFLVDLCKSGDPTSGWPEVGIARHFGADQDVGHQWYQVLQDLGLTTLEGLRAVQFIPLCETSTHVPDDCLSAPARVYFELTRRCNLTCRTCFNESHRALRGELATREIMDILAQLNELGTFEIRFTGGEPTQHPDLPDIISTAKALGFHISLGSNGVYSNATRSWIFDIGVDWFIISLDGTEQINDRLRGRGTYRQVVRTIRDLARYPDVRKRLNMVVGRHNVHTIEAVAQLAVEHAVDSLNMIPLRPYGRSVTSMQGAMFDHKDFYAFIQYIYDLRQRYPLQFITTLDLLDPEVTTSHDPIVQKRRTCAAGVEAAVIGATGDVYGCSYSPASFPDSPDIEGRRLFVAGSLRQDTMRDIWSQSERWAVFRDVNRFKNVHCQSCSHYQVRCVGSCPIMGYYQTGEPDAFDPYCFVDLMPVSWGRDS